MIKPLNKGLCWVFQGWLDRQTQQNASIASQTHDVAVLTDQIAKLVVSSADEKEFKGKNEVKGKGVKTSEVKQIPTTSVKSVSSKVVNKVTKHEPTTNIITAKSSKEDDEWESF